MKTLIISFCSLLLLYSPALLLSEEGFKGQPSYGAWQLNKLKAKHKSAQTNNAPTQVKKTTPIIIHAAEAEKRGQAIERQMIVDRATGADRPKAKTWTDAHGNTRPLTDELIAAEKARLEKSGQRYRSEKIRKLEDNPAQYFYDEEVEREEARSFPPTVIVHPW